MRTGRTVDNTARLKTRASLNSCRNFRVHYHIRTLATIQRLIPTSQEHPPLNRDQNSRDLCMSPRHHSGVTSIKCGNPQQGIAPLLVQQGKIWICIFIMSCMDVWRGTFQGSSSLIDFPVIPELASLYDYAVKEGLYIEGEGGSTGKRATWPQGIPTEKSVLKWLNSVIPQLSAEVARNHPAGSRLPNSPSRPGKCKPRTRRQFSGQTNQGLFRTWAAEPRTKRL